MAKEVPTKSGNPYHDEETGEFTSEGISALKSEVLSDNKLNDKQSRILSEIKENGGLYNFVHSLNLDNPINRQKLNFLVDDYISIPLFLKSHSWELKKITGQNLKVNTNALLDEIGVDLICYDDLSNITPKNIYEKMNIIDVKTAVHGEVAINVFQTVSGGKIVKSDLANPKYKNNNLYAFSFLDNLPANNNAGLALKMLNPNDLSLKNNNNIVNRAFLINSEDFHNLIHEYLELDNLDSAYDLLNSREWATPEAMMSEVFSKDEEMKRVSGELEPIIRYEMPLAPGLKLCASCYKESKTLNFRAYVSATKDFIYQMWPNSELSYTNVKNNKFVL